uniref:Lipase maturation factor n=1 Tax=Salmo trutta TaxID=8032 RepID=A0A673XTZ9_SALTR
VCVCVWGGGGGGIILILFHTNHPVPNSMSYYIHQSPWWFHRFEVLSNHFVELIVLLFTFLGRRMVNGTLQIVFQVTLVVSGNLSLLIWLTIVPRAKQDVPDLQAEEASPVRLPSPVRPVPAPRRKPPVMICGPKPPVMIHGLEPVVIIHGTKPPVMIHGPDITKERTEVILQGTLSTDQKDPEAVWKDYRPCFIFPYHYGLHWRMWPATFQTYEQSQWVIHIEGRLLANDTSILSLMEQNPFQGRDSPSYTNTGQWRGEPLPLSATELSMIKRRG